MIHSQLGSLASLSAVVLTGGIAFLYDQADELLQDRPAGEQPDTLGRPTSTWRAEIEGQAVMAHVPNLSRVNETALAALEGDIRDLRDLLRPYRMGELPISGENMRLLERIARLRVALQAVYGQRIEFQDEKPEALPSPLIDLEVATGLVRDGVIPGHIDAMLAAARMALDVTELDVKGDLTIGRFGSAN
jgi:hypothetical protein